MSNNLLDRTLFVVFLVMAGVMTGYGLGSGRDILNSLLFGFGVSMALSIAGMVTVTIYSSMNPPLPNCRSGNCTSEDYERVMSAFGNGSGRVREVHYECKCGNGFVHKGDMFYEKADSGELTPFKKRKLLRWIEADSKMHTGEKCDCEVVADVPSDRSQV